MLKIEGLTELQAAAVTFSRVEAPIRRAIQAEARTWAPTLVQAAKMRAEFGPQHAIASSARTSVTNRGPKAVFGSSGSTGRGAPLARVARPFEFGTNNQKRKTTYYARQRQTKRSMQVTRNTVIQLPYRNAKGRFIYPAVAETVPDLVARYVRAIARAVTTRG